MFYTTPCEDRHLVWNDQEKTVLALFRQAPISMGPSVVRTAVEGAYQAGALTGLGWGLLAGLLLGVLLGWLLRHYHR